MLYTGLDASGGIVGLATAPHPAGPWADQGAIFQAGGILPESATLFEHAGTVYLFYTVPYVGGHFVAGPALAGPWSSPRRLARGWAHEVWAGPGGLHTSFLRDYTVTITPLSWSLAFTPPQPIFGLEAHTLMFPLIGG
jgi:hypothetical protein